jgi:hypothetical protein
MFNLNIEQEMNSYVFYVNDFPVEEFDDKVQALAYAHEVYGISTLERN